MRDIAVAADLSPANLYHYFSGKDEILFSCQTLTLDRLQAAADAAAAAKGPLAARLRALAVDHVLCIVDQMEGSAGALRGRRAAARLRTAIVARRDRYERAVRALVAAGIRRGELRADRSGRGHPRFSRRAELDGAVVSSRRPAARRRDCLVVADYAVGGLENRRGANADRAHRQRRTARSRVRRRTRRCSRCCVRT